MLYRHAPADFTLCRVNANGEVLWSNPAPLPNTLQPLRLAVSAEGDPLVSGIVGRRVTPAVFAARFDTQGNRRWLVEYLPATTVNARSFCGMEATADGGLVLTGVDYTYTPINLSSYLLALDGQGNKRWERAYPFIVTSGYTPRQTAQGGFLLTGISGRDGPLQVLKTNPVGLVEELKTYTSLRIPVPVALFLKPNGQRLVVGTHADYPQCFTLTLGAQGELLNQVKTIFTTPRYERGGQDGDVALLPGGSLVFFIREPYQFDQIYLKKTDATGKLMWSKLIAEHRRP